MSGYFMIRREAMEPALHHVSGVGFKILLDLVASSPRPLKIRELPYEFRERQAGESKLDLLIVWQFLMMLWDKRLGRVMPARFVSFSLIGALGVVVHFAILSLLFQAAGADFVVSQALAAVGAMTGNFLLNNLLTYRDQRLRGGAMLRGWLTFTLACSVGAGQGPSPPYLPLTPPRPDRPPWAGRRRPDGGRRRRCRPGSTTAGRL
jgi:dolichol-phosphate mannosyltransferase